MIVFIFGLVHTSRVFSTRELLFLSYIDGKLSGAQPDQVPPPTNAVGNLTQNTGTLAWTLPPLVIGSVEFVKLDRTPVFVMSLFLSLNVYLFDLFNRQIHISWI